MLNVIPEVYTPGDTNAGNTEHLGIFGSEWRERTPLHCLSGQTVVRKRREKTSVGTVYKLFCGLFAFEESALSLGCDKWAWQIKVS